MSAWILILVLTGPAGDAVQIEAVAAPFATWGACNAAGMEARGLPVLTAPGSEWNRIDWVCVSTGAERDACAERERARERLREEFRKARAPAPAATPTPTQDRHDD